MEKTVKNIVFAVMLALLSCSSFAANTANNEDYNIDYYEDEGRLLFKIRAFGLITNSKQTGLPRPTNAADNTALIHNGFGIDSATVIFFNDNIASELSLGVNVLCVRNSAITNIANNYSDNGYSAKKKNVYTVPLTLTGQYHIAPFGAIRPYVGAGYHGAYLLTKSKAFKINNGHGAVLQLGIDFVAKDDTLINFDIRQYFLKTKVTYKGDIVNGRTDVKSRITLNPLVISLGMGFKL